jgi:DNA-binding MarR family transcriptional regulator
MERSLEKTSSEVEALLWIHRFPRLRIEDLRELLGMSHPGAVRLVSGLIADGLVVRERHRKDRRAVSVRTTEVGSRRALRAMIAGHHVTSSLVDRLPRAWVVRLVVIAERLLGGLARDIVTGHRICRFCQWAACRRDETAPCPVVLATTTHDFPDGPPVENEDGLRMYEERRTVAGTDPPIELWLEPGGIAFLLPASRRLEVICRGEQHGHLETERLPEGHVALYAWPGATFTVVEAGKEILIEERPLSLRAGVTGRTMRERIESLHGDFQQRRREPDTRWL